MCFQLFALYGQSIRDFVYIPHCECMFLYIYYISHLYTRSCLIFCVYLLIQMGFILDFHGIFSPLNWTIHLFIWFECVNERVCFWSIVSFCRHIVKLRPFQFLLFVCSIPHLYLISYTKWCCCSLFLLQIYENRSVPLLKSCYFVSNYIHIMNILQ